MELQVIGRDIYVRHTGVDGKSRAEYHRTWDADTLLKSLQAAVDKVNRDKGAGSRAAIQQITKEQYLKERKK